MYVRLFGGVIYIHVFLLKIMVFVPYMIAVYDIGTFEGQQFMCLLLKCVFVKCNKP